MAGDESVNPSNLLIATTNLGKLREVREVLDLPGLKLTCLADHPKWDEPIEDAEDFEGNASLKALHYAKLAGGWVVADDSGLEVDALDLQPGVRSARFGGPARDDAANNRKLISMLADVRLERRTARFRCAMALANDEGIQAIASGSVEGLIRDEPAGSNGFGYDPHFYVISEQKTSAELTSEHKNRISHRGEALRKLIPSIEQFLLPAR